MNMESGLRFVGHGLFGQFMSDNLTGAECRFRQVIPAFTRKSGLDWITDVLECPEVQAVYIATPDDTHHKLAADCIRAGKQVLCEKPIYEFEDLYNDVLVHAPTISFMVGFHRRFDDEYLKAVAAVQEKRPSLVVIESRDPVPHHTDTRYVVANAMCHDIDILLLMFPGATVRLQDVVVHDHPSDITAALAATDPATGAATAVSLVYSKGHTSYRQQVHVSWDAGATWRTFGYDHSAQVPEDCAPLYRSAYHRQWRQFYAYASDPAAWAADRKQLLDSYRRTFALVADMQGLVAQPPS